MQNKLLIFLIILLFGYTPIVFAEEINITQADYVWNLTLDNATNISAIPGEPGVMVVKYADDISYKPLENAASVGRLIGEPGVMVVKYADDISYEPSENPTSVGRRELEITINYPQNGALIQNSTVKVNGTATSPNEITSIMVNRVLASGTTSWNAIIPLTTGINTITVNATTNTTYSAEKSIQVFHYTTDIRLFGDFNGNGELDSGDVTILMRKIVGLE